MPANLQKQMLGGDGVMRLIDSSSTILSTAGYLFDYLVVNEPAVISNLEDEFGVSLTASTQWNIASKTLNTGILIIGKNGARIRAVTVTSGSVVGYQSRDYGNLRV